jgi:hypothetical protein
VFAGPKHGATKWKMIECDEHNVVKFKDEDNPFPKYLQADPKGGMGMAGDECADDSDKWVLCGLGPSKYELVNKFFGNLSLIAENEEVSLEEDYDSSRPRSYWKLHKV